MINLKPKGLIVLGIGLILVLVLVVIFNSGAIIGGFLFWDKLFPPQKIQQPSQPSPVVTPPNYFSIAGGQEYSYTNYFDADGTVNMPVTSPIYGIALDADVEMDASDSLIRVVLVDTSNNDYLIYEGYPLVSEGSTVKLTKYCDETCALDGVTGDHLRIEVTEGAITLNKISVITDYAQVDKDAKEKGIKLYNDNRKGFQNKEKIATINKNIQKNGLYWLAGETSVSEMTFNEKKNLFGKDTVPNLQGFEYYTQGIFSSDAFSLEPSGTVAATSAYVSEWDWRNRHGQNWVTPPKNQGNCGSCWDFATTAAVESAVNLYYNQHLDINLSEQDILSCANAGSCAGGNAAFTYVKSTGIVDEACFPYKAVDANGCSYSVCNLTPVTCPQKCSNPADRIKIAGTSTSSVSDDNLKKIIIQTGSVYMALYAWSHAMEVVGFGTIKAGDRVYDGASPSISAKIVNASDPLIGSGYYVFKNSWGASWGERGFAKIYFKNISTASVTWTGALGPINSLQPYQVSCTDNDADGYCNWGLGSKPATCPAGCAIQEDCDDSNPLLTYYLQDYSCAMANPVVGSISIDSNPSAAQAFVDSSFAGLTPVLVGEVPIGTHTVKISLAGYNDYSTSVIVNENETSTVSANLVRIPAGNLDVSSTPSGASLYLDNILKGTTPIVLTGLSTGSHIILLTLTDYYDYSNSTTIYDNTTTYLNVNFVRKNFYGNLNLTSSPTGASAYVDNVLYGITPITIRLLEGAHTVKVSKKGYMTNTTTVNIIKDQTIPLNIVLRSNRGKKSNR